MNVDFSFCLIFIRKLNFYLTESILLETQAFTSPPDMASSGVWEIIILTKTPTSEGVCRMLYFIIFLNFLPNVCYLLTDVMSSFLIFMTDVIVILLLNH